MYIPNVHVKVLERCPLYVLLCITNGRDNRRKSWECIQAVVRGKWDIRSGDSGIIYLMESEESLNRFDYRQLSESSNERVVFGSLRREVEPSNEDQVTIMGVR